MEIGWALGLRGVVALFRGDTAAAREFQTQSLRLWWELDEQARRRYEQHWVPYALETSVPGVFAAGDVRFDSMKRVASAVGEGAMAVHLVHRYLATI